MTPPPDVGPSGRRSLNAPPSAGTAGGGVTDLASALPALADLGVHPVGVTVDGQLIALRLSAADQTALLADEARREQIVATLKAHGFLYITLELQESLGGVAQPGRAGDS